MWCFVSTLTNCIFIVTLLTVTRCLKSEEAKGQGQARTFFRKLKIPRGSSLSLTAQVSRPKLLPEFMVNKDAVIMDGVVELPMWLDIDRMADALYGDTDEDGPTGPKSNNNKIPQFRGKERCLLYEGLASALSTLFFLPTKKSKSCVLRAICEMHEVKTYYFPHQCPSFTFEMILLFLSPSLGGGHECHQEYRLAENEGINGACHKSTAACPFNVSALIFKKLVPRNWIQDNLIKK